VENSKISGVLMLKDKMSETPSFAHPVKLEHAIVIDCRGLIANTDSMGGFRIKDQGEVDFRTIRAGIEHYWGMEEDNKDDLVTCSDLPLDIYTKYFSEGLTHRLGLDPETQGKLSVLAGLYYLSLCEEQMNDKTWQRNVAIVSRVTRVTASRIVEWFPEQLNFRTLEELTQYISGDALNNPRLRSVNPALIFGILGQGWFTQHGSEVMCAAIEFPPIWMACVFFAVDNRALRNSRISKLIQRSAKDGADELYRRALLSIIK